jgi:hypothetical protein
MHMLHVHMCAHKSVASVLHANLVARHFPLQRSGKSLGTRLLLRNVFMLFVLRHIL